MNELDEELIKKAFALTANRTEKEQEQQTLRKSAQSREKRNLLELSGRIQFCEGFDYKKLRETDSSYF